MFSIRISGEWMKIVLCIERKQMRLGKSDQDICACSCGRVACIDWTEWRFIPLQSITQTTIGAPK